MRLLSEGIGHLDDLDINKFIDVIKNIADKEISEKIDGSNLAFGLDVKGKFFTTRRAKNTNANLVYKATDYPQFSTFNGFRAAHAALETQVEKISEVLNPGDTIEIEVVLGNQPNVVSYDSKGNNYVLFLRPLHETTFDTFQALVEKLKNIQVDIDSELITSADGASLSTEKKKQTFIFSTPQKIDGKTITTDAVNKHLQKLEKFLRADSQVENLANAELLKLSLSTIPQDKRAEIKSKKADLISAISQQFKLPIKHELLKSILPKIKSQFHSDEGDDIGIEGVVLLDTSTGEQVKIVDKDTYTTVNQFNHAVRGQIMGMIRTVDSSAALEDRGGIIGDMRIKIADLFGDSDFAKGSVIKRALTKTRGQTPQETIVNFTKSLNLPQDFNGIKRKILAIISAANKNLSDQRDDFKSSNEKYQLKLKTGKVIQLSAEVISRTLTSFAEAGVGLKLLFEKAKKAKTYEQLIAIFYGKYAINLSENVTESLIFEKKIQTDKRAYAGKDAWTLLNIYFATLFSSILVYKAEDKIGMRLLKDKANYQMKSWSAQMSPLNFWGLVIWRPSSPPVKKLIGAKVSSEILRTTRRVPKLWWLNLHLDMCAGREAPIHWQDHIKTCQLLQWHPNLRTDRISYLMTQAFQYDKLTLDEKNKFLDKLYFYLHQFIPNSPLIERIRAIQNEIFLNPADAQQIIMPFTEGLLHKINLTVNEDDSVIATSSADISSVDSRINTRVIRRQKNVSINRRNLSTNRNLK